MEKTSLLKPLQGNRKTFRYAVMDIEATDWIKPFALGFLDPWEQKESRYRDFLGEDCVEKFLNFFLSKRFRSYRVFIHNGGKYDFSFLIDKLLHDPGFSLKIMKNTGGRILRLQIQSNITESMNWWFMDSFALLPMALRKLCKSFKPEHMKKEIDYENIKKGAWRDYLYYDVMALYEIIAKFKEYFDTHGVGLKTTLAQQALSTFRTKLSMCLPSYLGHEGFIRQAYHGGRVEVFKRYGEGLNYYDFNSLYPSCMLGPMPIGRPRKVMGPYPKGSLGFAEAVVKIPYEHIPLLPHRWKQKLVFPYGKLKGIWDIAELNKAREKGYEVRVIRSLIFDQAPIFCDYIHELYGIKKSAKGNKALYLISKLLLNALYGKFGQGRVFDDVLINPDMSNFEDGKIMEVCHDLNIWSKEKFNKSPHILPALSAHIAALARLKLYGAIEKCKNDVCYIDTDSVITPRRLRTSDSLGGLKREHKVVRGYFIAPKFYYLQPNPDKPIVRIKGFPNNAFSEQAFKEALDNNFRQFHYEQDVFGLFSENVRRHKRIVGMVKRSKSIKSLYDKRRVFGLDTRPLQFMGELLLNSQGTDFHAPDMEGNGNIPAGPQNTFPWTDKTDIL